MKLTAVTDDGERVEITKIFLGDTMSRFAVFEVTPATVRTITEDAIKSGHMTISATSNDAIIDAISYPPVRGQRSVKTLYQDDNIIWNESKGMPKSQYRYKDGSLRRGFVNGPDGSVLMITREGNVKIKIRPEDMGKPKPNDFVARHGLYILRVEQMDAKAWWWAVYFGQEEVASSNDTGNTGSNESHAKALCELAMLRYAYRHTSFVGPVEWKETGESFT